MRIILFERMRRTNGNHFVWIENLFCENSKITDNLVQSEPMLGLYSMAKTHLDKNLDTNLGRANVIRCRLEWKCSIKCRHRVERGIESRRFAMRTCTLMLLFLKDGGNLQWGGRTRPYPNTFPFRVEWSFVRFDWDDRKDRRNMLHLKEEISPRFVESNFFSQTLWNHH